MEPKCRATPYEGSEPFIFFSYCHKDSAVVYPLIEALTRMGYRIWFDSGITIGDEWPEVIADKLEKCTAFLPAITRAYCFSHNCKNELTFQVEDKKLILPLKIEDFPLIGGIRLQLANTQHVLLSGLPQTQWAQAVAALAPLAACKGAPIRLAQEDAPPAEPSLIDRILAQPVPEPEEPAQEEDPVDPWIIPSIRDLSDQDPSPQPVDGTRSETQTIPADDDTIEEQFAPFFAVCLPEGTLLHPADRQLRLPGSMPERGALLEGTGGLTIRPCGGASVRLSGVEAAEGGTPCPDCVVAEVDAHRYAVLQGSSTAWARQQGALFLLEAEATGEQKLILPDGLPLGRSYPWAHGSMRDARISHSHGSIALSDGGACLTDTSKNGTYINDRRIDSGAPGTALHDGDVLRLGREQFRFHQIPLHDTRAQLQEAYRAACESLAHACTQEDYLAAAQRFEALEDFEDSRQQHALCLEKAEAAEKNLRLAQARELAAPDAPEGLEAAIALLTALGAWQDAPALLAQYRQRLEQLRALERRYQDACGILAGADSLQRLAEAERMFAALGSYRDSGSQQLRCREKAEALRRAQQENAQQQNADDDERTVRDTPAAPERLLLIDLATGETFPGKVQSTVIGRKVNQCDIPFPANSRMSRRHAEVFAHGGKHFVRDCHSANGTFVDGRRLEPEQTVQIGETAVLTLADEQILAAFDAAAARISEMGYAALLRRESDGALLPITIAPLRFDYIDQERTVLIGRTPGSRCAELTAERDGIVLRAFQPQCVSVDGTLLNEGQRLILSGNAELVIGEEKYQYLQIPLVLFCGRSNAQ